MCFFCFFSGIVCCSSLVRMKPSSQATRLLWTLPLLTKKTSYASRTSTNVSSSLSVRRYYPTRLPPSLRSVHAQESANTKDKMNFFIFSPCTPPPPLTAHKTSKSSRIRCFRLQTCDAQRAAPLSV